MLLARKVYKAPYLSLDGAELLIAVDSRGRVRKHLKLSPGIDELRATAWMEEQLDRIDPVPVLALVRDTPKKVTAVATRSIDPALYADPRSPLAKRRYLRTLAQSAARAMLGIARAAMPVAPSSERA